MTTAQIDAAIRQLQEEVDAASAELTAARASLNAWLNAQQQDAANNASYDTRQNTARRVAEEQKRVNDAETLLKRKQKELEERKQYRQAIEDAALAAIRSGMTPEAAYAAAEAKVIAERRRTTIFNYITIAIVLLLIAGGIWWFVKKRKG